jgi:serine/threonine protein kinase
VRALSSSSRCEFVLTPSNSRYSWCDDLTISRLHLRIHCILYDQDPDSNIAPFVYATDLSANGTYLKKSNAECTASQDPGILMGKNVTFLLDDEDELHISETVTLIYFSKRPVEPVRLTPIQERERQVFASRYLVTGRLLGEGGYGKVLVGVNQETQRQLACKIIRLDKLWDRLAVPNLRLPTGGKTDERWPPKVRNCFREFDILKDLSHPNIVAIEKVFYSHNTIFIFQELVTGGDLFSFLEYKDGRLDSMQAATVIRQVLKGIDYLHDLDIVHRDLKPDNILMTSLKDGARLVITDFGNARFLPGKNSQTALRTNKYQRMFSYVGTLEYAAPEIHRANRTIPPDDGYSKSVDMWSIGSITAAVLTGDVLFTDRKHPDYEDDPQGVIVGLAAICDLSILDDKDHPNWSVIGDRPKDFIKGLLILDEEARMTASDALVHPWFSSFVEDFEDLYARSIADWEPREKDLQLVEAIANPKPNYTVGSLFGTTSRHFHASQPGPTYKTLRKKSASQRWRANTPLPSISQDYEAAQFASQMQPPSYDTDAAGYGRQQGYTPINYSQNAQQSYEASARDKADSQSYGAPFSRSAGPHLRRGKSIGTSLSQLSLTNAAASGKYDNNADDDEHSDDSEASLNRVANDYSQQHFIRLPSLPESQDVQESVQVGETPIDDQAELDEYGYDEYGDHDEELDESYHQTQFPQECQQQQAADDEPDSSIVRETPPELLRKHGRSFGEGLPTYEEWFCNDESGEAGAARVRGKRRRLSHYTH